MFVGTDFSKILSMPFKAFFLGSFQPTKLLVAKRKEIGKQVFVEENKNKLVKISL